MMKVDLEDLLRDTLREAAGSGRFDPHGWRPAAPDVTPRRLRIRVPHPVRSRAVAVLVAAILIAGITVPLILLSRLGGEDPIGPRSSGRTVQGYGMRLDVPEGWDGRTVGPDPDGLGPSLHVANFSLPQPDEVDGDRAFAALRPGRTMVLLEEVTIRPLAPGAYPPLEGNLSVDVDDVRRFGPFPASVHSYVRDDFSISGRQFNFLVGFGDPPSPSLVEDLNHVLATLEVERVTEPAGYRLEADVDDGLSITIPAGWTFDEDPTQPIEPENVFAFGSWDFPSGGVCAPFAALEELPLDGAFVWMVEYHGTDHPEDFVSRPERFDLRDFRFGETSCEGTPMYQLRFRDGGRFFQWQVAFGPQASEATEADTLLALDSLRAGDVCDTGNDGYVPGVVPTSGVAGTQATVGGEFPHGEPGPGGYPVEADAEWVEVWWNLDPSEPGGWSSALPGGEDPIAAESGPVFKLGRVDVMDSCTYEVPFEIPHVEPGVYPVVVIQMDPESASSFQPAHLEVTG
jgi:hypothetical protein